MNRSDPQCGLQVKTLPLTERATPTHNITVQVPGTSTRIRGELTPSTELPPPRLGPGPAGMSLTLERGRGTGSGCWGLSLRCHWGVGARLALISSAQMQDLSHRPDFLLKGRWVLLWGMEPSAGGTLSYHQATLTDFGFSFFLGGLGRQTLNHLSLSPLCFIFRIGSHVTA
jgi:hypothetical protein